MQAADDIAHDLKTDPSARSLYEYGTLPGVVNLSKIGALPIKNYTTNDPANARAQHDASGRRPSCARASTTAGTSATRAACTTATCR